MNTHATYAVLVVLAAVGTISVSQSWAQINPACPDCESADVMTQIEEAKLGEIPISVWTDSDTYNHEASIMVNGRVANVRSGVPVTLTVTSPLNNIVTIQQIDVADDGTFSTTLSTAGNLWKYDGTYIIRVQYGSQEINNKVMVELTEGVKTAPMEPAPTPSMCGSTELSVGGQCVPFMIDGGMVTGTSINTKDNSITIGIDATDDGTLTISPSNEVIDGVFMVLVDGEEWDDVEFDGNKITVMFPAGTEEIEIIGTFVIPEFGTIAALILAVAIVSIIAVSARSRLSIMPRF